MSVSIKPSDCLVDAHGDCAVVGNRKWDWNLPSLIAIIGMLAVWLGSFAGYVIMNDRRVTKLEGEVEVGKLADKGISDHSIYVEQANVRDRQEMREDIKEIKRLLQEKRR